MRCTVRGRHTRSEKPETSTDTNTSIENCQTDPDPDSDSDYIFGDGGGSGYCTEKQLEEMLSKNLEFLYNEALKKLVGLGYDEELALKAILRNGHCYGGMDFSTNVLHNSLACLNTSEEEEPETLAFVDLGHLVDHSLVGMIRLLQQIKPHLSKGDSMWCLMMSGLHMGRASLMEIPVSPSCSGTGGDGDGGGVNKGGVVSGMQPALCRFHPGGGFGSGGMSVFPINEMSLQREIEYPKRFNLSPSMKCLLKKNVAMFAAGFRASSVHSYSQSLACPSSLSGGASSSGHGEESRFAKSQDVVNSMMSKFGDLNLDGNSEEDSLDPKYETLLGLIDQVKDLEKQLKERKDWAHQKAMQAARKLSNDLTELKNLRMERDENQLLQKGKLALDDATMKRLSEMENALRRASGQVDRANAAVRKFEMENAEIRAEMEACKLSASESVQACLEVAKREKKFLKRLLALERQKGNMQEDIAAEKRKISEVQHELSEVDAATKRAEEKLRQEQKAKELALAYREEERRLKEALEPNIKRKLESLDLKIEIDFQRHKDDLQRLEQEYQRLKESANPTEAGHQNFYGVSAQGETIAQLLDELDTLEVFPENEESCDRECMICMKDEVSVVFLPCAHQVICANCNEKYGKKSKASCPCCRAPIEQRIRVYGAS